MNKGAKRENIIIVDEDDNEDTTEDRPANEMPGSGRTVDTLREQLGEELGVDLTDTNETDSVNLKIVKPKMGKTPFPASQRLTGVIIISLFVFISVVGLSSATIYATVIVIPSLIILGYIMTHLSIKPAFESMIYILIVTMIIVTGFGSRTSSGLELYSITVVLILLLVFYRMTKSKLVIVPFVLFAVWLTIFVYYFWDDINYQ
jgi:hypothetical protein